MLFGLCQFSFSLLTSLNLAYQLPVGFCQIFGAGYYSLLQLLIVLQQLQVTFFTFAPHPYGK